MNPGECSDGPMTRVGGECQVAGRPPGAVSTDGLKLALFCSVKCPGKLILDAYDFAKRLCRERITVIGGFHSPMEQECLRILLRSSNTIIWCLARGKMSRIPPDLCAAVKAGQLQILSPFPDRIRRVTAANAERRNRVVADMADAVVIVHAAPRSKIEMLSQGLLSHGKAIYTFDHAANAPLIASGAQDIQKLALATL